LGVAFVYCNVDCCHNKSNGALVNYNRNFFLTSTSGIFDALTEYDVYIDVKKIRPLASYSAKKQVSLWL
jgi:hypothetical protein